MKVEGRWEIAGDWWTAKEIQRASAMAREQSSIDSLAGRDPQVQLTWLSRARGRLAHEALMADPTYVHIPVPLRRDQEEAAPAPVEGLQTGPRLAMKHEIPASCNTLWKNALKAGWWCYILYVRGHWTELDGDLKLVRAYQIHPNHDVEEVEIVGMVEMVILRGWSKGAKFQASWVLKPWTKDAKFKYQAGHFWPDGNGLVASPELTKRVKGVWPVEPVITEQEYS